MKALTWLLGHEQVDRSALEQYVVFTATLEYPLVCTTSAECAKLHHMKRTGLG